MPFIRIDGASVGMVLSTSVYDSDGVLMIKEGVTLTERDIIKLLKRGITQIDIEDEYTLKINPIDTLRKEIIKKVCDTILYYAPLQPEANPSDMMINFSQASCKMIEKIAEDDVVMANCSRMKLVNRDLFEHSCTVCALSMLVTASLGLGPGGMFHIGMGALLHDIGMLEIPHLITSDSEMGVGGTELFKEHPLYGYYIGKDDNLHADVLAMIQYHHENYNGSGYPYQIAGIQIPIGARVISVVDTFDRMVRFNSVDTQDVLDDLFRGSDRIYDLRVVSALLKNIAIYPLGSLVKLSTGETGVVVNVRRNAVERPIVDVWYDAADRIYNFPKSLDLGDPNFQYITIRHII